MQIIHRQNATGATIGKGVSSNGGDDAVTTILYPYQRRYLAEASRASIGQKRWAEEVKVKLDAIEREAGKAGRTLDAETLRAVREGLYGG
jgi:hypothetical protein